MRKLALPLALLLAGCSSGTPIDAPSPTSEELAAAVELAGLPPANLKAPLEFGDFDPNAEGFELFKPCEEISAEVYKALGMGESYGGDLELGGELGCTFSDRDHPKDLRTFSVVTSRAPIQRLHEADIKVRPGEVFEGVEINYIEFPDEENESCDTSVDTSRGRWALSQDINSAVSKEEACRNVMDLHKQLITYVKGE